MRKKSAINPEKILSAKQFVDAWDVPTDTQEHLYGNKQLSDIHTRQARLVGNVVDAAIILHVYEKLLDNTSLEELALFLPKTGLKPQEIDTLTGADNDAKLAQLITMSKSARLMNHNFVSQDTWDRHKAKFELYKDQLKSGEVHSSLISSPPDPRIKAINALMGSTIQILNPGPKEEEAIRNKLNRQHVNIQDLKDINRLGILPKNPQYAEDFIKIIELLNPPKNVNNNGTPAKLSRIYEEPWEVFENGYFTQKLILALDRNHAGNPTGGKAATIGEIKIIPPSMLQAEKLSALIKPLIEQTSIPSLYISTKPKDGSKNKDDEIEKQRRERLTEDYADKLGQFGRKIAEFKEQQNKQPSRGKKIDYDSYRFPAFPQQNLLNKPQAYQALNKALLELSRKIHAEAVMAENFEWQKKYLETALIQRDDHKNLKSKDDKEARDDRMSMEWLQKIADVHGLSLKGITAKLLETRNLNRLEQSRR